MSGLFWPEQVANAAVLDQARLFRYILTRTWTEDPVSYCMIIGLNPSTADENVNDPTIRRCMTFARDWGYGGLVMGNLFGFRATDPQAMLEAEDPVGRDNDFWLHIGAGMSDLVVAAWGTKGNHLDRDKHVRHHLPKELHVLRFTKDGHPEHPLYLPKALKPQLWV